MSAWSLPVQVLFVGGLAVAGYLDVVNKRTVPDGLVLGLTALATTYFVANICLGNVALYPLLLSMILAGSVVLVFKVMGGGEADMFLIASSTMMLVNPVLVVTMLLVSNTLMLSAIFLYNLKHNASRGLLHRIPLTEILLYRAYTPEEAKERGDVKKHRCISESLCLYMAGDPFLPFLFVGYVVALILSFFLG